MNRKGISQILFLIIAASVLMMVALTLIFMFQSGASDTTQQADAQTCRSSAQAQCSNLGGSSVIAPNSCYNQQEGTYGMTSGLPANWQLYTTDALSTTVGGGSSSPPFYLDCGQVL
mgnify:FL=1